MSCKFVGCPPYLCSENEHFNSGMGVSLTIELFMLR